MIDMGAVRAEVEAARAELLDEEDNPKAILSLGTRKRVWRAMIDPDDAEASYRRRIELKMACVRRVQHYWEQYYPGDSGSKRCWTWPRASSTARRPTPARHSSKPRSS